MKVRRSIAGGYQIAVIVVLGLGLIGTFVFGRSYGELALRKEPFHRTSYTPSFDPVEDVSLGLSPNTTTRSRVEPNAAIRAIEVYPTQTILFSGGKVIRSINTHAPATLHRLVKIVASRGWISESAHTVTLQAAVLIEHGSSMTITSPVTSQLVMSVRPGVFLAASQGKIDLSGVYVHASNTKVPTTFSQPSRVAGRPFVLAAQNSTMNISDCVFRYLGRDWNSSYGLSWSKGSTGSVRNSIFQHNFIGVYSNDSDGLRVEHNKFYFNSLYGIDPHSGSSHLLIEHNISDFNGRHGIIFSDHVTNGIVRYNVTSGNGLNGIMMDASSAHNTIEHNTVVGNRSDGIVIANSSSDVVAANIINHNRVGITVRGNADDNIIAGNKISNNEMAAQGTGLSRNTVYGNGGEWSARRISIIWSAAVCLLLALLAVTWASKTRRSSRH
jgi:mannuronan 5-epimerase